jgi:hypothetical protein
LFPDGPDDQILCPRLVIESREDLQEVVLKLIQDYDLSTIVIKSLIRNALSRSIERRRKEGYLEVEASDILTAFDQVFEEILSEEKVPQPVDFELESFWETQKASEYLWRFLRNSRLKIPMDYDTDGVCGIFRLIDGVLLSRLPMRPRLGEALQINWKISGPKQKKYFPWIGKRFILLKKEPIFMDGLLPRH